jgi:hypothetical protein
MESLCSVERPVVLVQRYCSTVVVATNGDRKAKEWTELSFHQNETGRVLTP